MDRLFFQQVYFSFEKTLQGIFQVKEIREVIIYVGLVKIDYQIYVALLIKAIGSQNRLPDLCRFAH